MTDSESAVRYMDSVYIFKARSFEDAHKQSVRLGREQEEEFLNVEKNRVRWRPEEIVSLDIIQKKSLDGAEVYSEPVELEDGTSIPFDATFSPEKSKPTQTI